MRGKTIRVPEKLRRETARGGSPLVRMTGLEPAHLSVLEPNGSVTLLHYFSSVILLRPIASVEALWRSAEVAGGSTPRTPSPIRPPLNPIIVR